MHIVLWRTMWSWGCSGDGAAPAGCVLHMYGSGWSSCTTSARKAQALCRDVQRSFGQSHARRYCCIAACFWPRTSSRNLQSALLPKFREPIIIFARRLPPHGRRRQPSPPTLPPPPPPPPSPPRRRAAAATAAVILAATALAAAALAAALAASTLAAAPPSLRRRAARAGTPRARRARIGVSGHAH
jgi:hypothetical protein